MGFAALNNEIIDEKDALIHINDKAYFFDFAVYSSIKVIQGKIFFPDFHVLGLLESARVIELNHQFSKENILEMLNKVVQTNSLKDAFLRIVLIGDANENKNARLFIFPVTGAHFYPDRFYKKGVKVISFKGERNFPNSKSKDLLLGFVASREANKAGAVEALLLDNQGNIREGTKSNFFAIKGNSLITPPKDKVLEGITRKIIFDVCQGNFNVIEEDIKLSKIEEYDEFFITSTLFNIMPINQIDDLQFSSNFEKTKLIQKLFKEYYDKNVLRK